MNERLRKKIKKNQNHGLQKEHKEWETLFHLGFTSKYHFPKRYRFGHSSVHNSGHLKEPDSGNRISVQIRFLQSFRTLLWFFSIQMTTNLLHLFFDVSWKWVPPYLSSFTLFNRVVKLKIVSTRESTKWPALLVGSRSLTCYLFLPCFYCSGRVNSHRAA